MKRGLTINMSCVHYSFQHENDQYILFDCEFAQKVWDQLPLGNKWRTIPTLNFKDLAHFAFTQWKTEEVLCLLFAYGWSSM